VTGGNLYTILTKGAAATPERPCLLRAAGGGLTYGDLDRLTARLAATLLAAGVRPGDRVAVQVEKSAEALALCLAVPRAGAVLLPLNPAYTPAELGYFLADAEPALIVGPPGSAASMAALAPAAATLELGPDGRGSLLERAAAMPAGFADVPRATADLAAILYTSGTTGRAKGAMLTVGNLAANARTLKDLWRFGPDDVLLHALPIFHTHGLFTAVNTLLLAGGALLLLPRFDAAAVLALLPRATAMMGVPTFYTRLLAEPGLTREAVAHIRLFVAGSAPLLPETHVAFAARTGHAILERYGMTETGMLTSNPYDGPRLPGSVGPPLPDTRLRIADPATGAPLGPGEVGGIEVQGPGVFAGYWRMPERTLAEHRPDGWFVTGDLGRIDERGYVHIVGRAKDLVISGGFNVYPREVEAVLDELPGVAESAVIGLPHPDLGEAVTAIVVPRGGAALDEAGLVAALAPRLARYKQPRRVLVVHELPRNTMGKVLKAVLRERLADLYRS
jgi:malonyl-CoA/methylmalonyl-CoA synthetase